MQRPGVLIRELVPFLDFASRVNLPRSRCLPGFSAIALLSLHTGSCLLGLSPLSLRLPVHPRVDRTRKTGGEKWAACRHVRFVRAKKLSL